MAPALVASIVPAVISGVTAAAGGISKAIAAKKQKEQAEKIRKDALNTKVQPLNPEFLAKKRMDNMAYLSGLPGYGLAKENIDEQAATNLRAIRENSPTGAATVSAISSALQLGNKANRELDINNAEFRAKKLSDVGNTEWAIGEKQRQLEDIRDQTKREGLTAASAMENAATANKMNAANTITGAISSTATSLGKTAQQQAFMKQLGSIYGSGANQTGATDNSDITPDATVAGGQTAARVDENGDPIQPNGSTLDSPEAKKYMEQLRRQGFGMDAIREYLLNQGYTE